MQPHRLVGPGRQPAPTPPPSPPAGAGSSVQPWPARTAGQAIQVGFAPVVQLPVPRRAWGRSCRPQLMGWLGKAALDAEHRALGHIQGLGHLGRRPTCIGLQQYPGPSGDPGVLLPREPGVPVGSAAPASTGLRIFPDRITTSFTFSESGSSFGQSFTLPFKRVVD